MFLAGNFCSKAEPRDFRDRPWISGISGRDFRIDYKMKTPTEGDKFWIRVTGTQEVRIKQHIVVVWGQLATATQLLELV